MRKSLGKVGLVYHPNFLKHELDGYHPENPDRLRSIISYLEYTGTMSKLEQLDITLPPENWIAENHDPNYIGHVKEACRSGIRFLDGGDTYCNEYSFDVARLAVGGCLKAGDEVINGRLKSCFCCVRPPGHHAVYNRAAGFCILNNIAILARYLRKEHNYFDFRRRLSFKSSGRVCKKPHRCVAAGVIN